MGLIQQIEDGTKFKRVNTTITKFGGDFTESGSTYRQAFGGAFILLKVSANEPCRIRLYSDESSMTTDAPRAIGNFNISESVGLIADINLDTTLSLTFDPPIIGNTFSDGNTYYNISGSQAETAVTFTTYPIGEIGDSSTDRSTIVIRESNISNTGYGKSGSLTTPKSFLILSASASTSQSRLRLYSTTVNNVPQTEIIRTFDTASVSGSKLIADFIFDSASFGYKLVPILEAYTWKDNQYTLGTGQVGYILQNISSTPTINTTASLYIYSTED